MSAENIEAIESQFASKDAPVAENEPAELPEVEATHEEESDAQDEAATSEGAEADQGKKKPGVHNRINELTKARREAERKAEAAEQEREYWRQEALKKSHPEPKKEVESEGPKTLADFDYDNERYFKYMVEQETAQTISRIESQRKQQEEAAKVKEKIKSYEERVAAFEAANPDIDYHEEVTKASLPISQPMAEFIIESDVGPQLGIYLRDNPAEAKSIFAMNPRQADRAMSKIEAKLSAKPEPAAPSPPVQITRAPPVASRVTASAVGKKAENSWTMEDEIAAVRERQKTR